jgi:hypothetical protein
MAQIVSLSVYAINSTRNATPQTVGVRVDLIKRVLPTRNGTKWIGTNKPSNYGQIYTEIQVAKDEAKNFTDSFYVARSVAEIITAINA